MSEFHLSCYAKCHYAKCHYAQCHYAESHYAECHYANCHYVECHYAESCGTSVTVSKEFVEIQRTAQKPLKVHLQKRYLMSKTPIVTANSLL